MSDVLVILGLVLFGPGLLIYVGFLLRRNRWRESVPLIEVAIDRAVGVQPPVRSRVDHFFTLAQLLAISFFGLVATGLGLFVILKDYGILE